MSAIRAVAVLIIVLATAGCGGPRAILGLGSNVSAASPAAIVPVFLATTRARSDNLSLPYSAQRSQTLNFAAFDIAIPKAHRRGSVESSGNPDTARHFMARSFQPIDGRKKFIERLDAALMQRAPEDRELFIFVHGYNNNIADSIFRAAQIAYDYNIRAVTLHYAWPSGGALPLYVYDRDSTVVGRGGLAETIEIAAQTKARKIILVGHSMGAYVVMEAFRELAQTGRSRYLKRLSGVVLAAPDIDMDAFQSQVRDIGELPRPFIIIVSRRDRALGISRRIAGGHARVGSGADIALLQKEQIAVLDVSELDSGSHNVFASSKTLMSLASEGQLMRRVIEGEGASAAETILADGSSVVEGAASLVVYLPARLLGIVGQAGVMR